jgi:hypothetical protein
MWKPFGEGAGDPWGGAGALEEARRSIAPHFSTGRDERALLTVFLAMHGFVSWR